MKRNLIAVAALLIVVFLSIRMIQSTNSDTENLVPSPFQEEELLPEEAAGVIVINTTLEREQMELTFRLYNTTEEILFYTQEWYIEKKVKGKWYQWLQPEAIDDILYSIFPHCEENLSIFASIDPNTDNSGNYRFIKPFGSKWFYSEFSLP